MRRAGRRLWNKTDNKGISLIELLVSVTILAIIVAPLLNVFVLSNRTNARARRRLRATEVGRNIMEFYDTHSKVLALDEFDWDGDTDPERPVKYYQVRNEMMDGGTYDVLIKVDSNPPESDNSAGNNVYTTVNTSDVIDLSPINSRYDAVSELVRNPNSDLEKIGSVYGVTLTTDNTSRTITLDIERDNNYVRATLSYKYTFLDSKGHEITYPNATASDAESFSDTMYYQDQSTYALKNIYVFFKPWYTSAYHAKGTEKDHIVINNQAHQNINVLLIKQKMEISGLRVAEERYSTEVSVKDVLWNNGEKGYICVRTNLGINLDSGAATKQAQAFYKLNGDSLTEGTAGGLKNSVSNKELPVSDLVSLKQENRLYAVTVSVYQRTKGNPADLKNDKPVAVITGGMTE